MSSLNSVSSISSMLWLRARDSYWWWQARNLLSILVPFKTVDYVATSYTTTKLIALRGTFPARFKLLFTLYVYHMTRLSVCNFETNHNIRAQLLWFDYFNLIGLPSNFDVTFSFLFVQFYFFYHYCYLKAYHHGTIKIAYQVLVRRQLNRFVAIRALQSSIC